MRELQDHIFEFLGGLSSDARKEILIRVHWLLDLPCTIFDEPEDLISGLRSHIEAPFRSDRDVPLRYAAIGRLLAVVAVIDHVAARLISTDAPLREAEAILLNRPDRQSQSMARRAEFQRHKLARDTREPVERWRRLRSGPLSPEILALLE